MTWDNCSLELTIFKLEADEKTFLRSSTIGLSLFKATFKNGGYPLGFPLKPPTDNRDTPMLGKRERVSLVFR